MSHLRVFGRGLLIVTLTAFNVGSIAHAHYLHAFAGGFAISFVWWKNSKTAAHSELRFGREAYAAGAALGTVLGMYLGGGK